MKRRTTQTATPRVDVYCEGSTGHHRYKKPGHALAAVYTGVSPYGSARAFL